MKFCRRGHALTKQNCRIHTDGFRRCRICHNLNNKLKRRFPFICVICKSPGMAFFKETAAHSGRCAGMYSVQRRKK